MKLTRRTTILATASLAATVLAGCGKTEPKAEAPKPAPPAPKPSEGKITVTGGNIAWRRIGDGPKTPLLCLHGGPGVPSDYLEPLGALGDERPVYLYDQLGCGRSDRPTDMSLWTIDRFIDELDKVRTGLGLSEMHLLGQSWGTMLGVEYLIRKGTTGIKSAVLAGPVMSVKRYAADAHAMIPALSPASRAAIAKAAKTKDFAAADYQAAVNEFDAKHLAIAPTAETGPLLEKTMAGINQDVYGLMNGPSEFDTIGTLKDFERVADLAKLDLPILFLSGEFDTATPAASQDYAKAAKRGEAVTIAASGHLTTIDQPKATNDAVRAFLHKAEA